MLFHFSYISYFSIRRGRKLAFFLTVGLFISLFHIPVSGASGNMETASKTLPVIHLHELEPKVNKGPDILLAVAELEESVSRLNQVEADSGLQAFAGSEVGRFREPLGDEDFREYNQLNLKAGLRHPLLGSNITEQKQILQSEYDVREKEKKQAILQRENLLLLRKQYIAYWAAQEKRLLTSEFLDDEQALTEALTYRKEAGLLLEADRLEFMSTLALVHRIAQKQLAIQKRAQGFMGHMTGEPIESFQAVFPQLKSPCIDAEEMANIIRAEHPRLAVINEKLDRQHEIIRLTNKSNLEGRVELVGRVSTETPNSGSGYGVFLNVQFDFPWKVKKERSAQRRIVHSILDQLKQQAVITESTLVMEASDALQAYKTAQKNIEFARQRLSAAQERVREDLLRLAYLPGDVIEKVQQSRTEALKAALDLVDGQAQKLVQKAVLLSYTESKISPDQVAEEENSTLRYYPEPSWKQAVNAIKRPDLFHGLTFYVWNAQNLPFDAEPRSQWFDKITQLGVKRLLLSFTPQQISAMQDKDERQSTVEFIRNAREHGICVELLLGEPSWILPVYRDSLVKLVRSFSDMPFQGIQLDLEPDQLSTPDQDKRLLLKWLCETVDAVKRATTLPVSLSIHYRYFQEPSTGTLLASSFDETTLDEIILMIYIADPKRVAAIAGSILERYPRLTFSVAQSVEPILSPAESNFRLTRENFLLKLASLSGQLKHPNFGSLVVQDWQSFLEMAP